MLDKIIENKIVEVKTLKADQKYSLSSLSEVDVDKRFFYDSLKLKIKSGKNAIIAELKKHSPSKGELNENLNVAEFAKLYENAGASCISVLTDQKYFHGNTDDLITAKKSVKIPILRKDFILDESQIIESKIIGADCILLIVACLSKLQFNELLSVSKELDMDVLVEVHDRKELDIALESDCKIIGINNRDLKTFNVDIETTIRLQNKIQNDDIIIISESGIKDIHTIKTLNENNIYAFLIGESLITDDTPAITLKNMVG